MPYLVVLGNGSWRPARGVTYRAGVHEVSEEVAAQARASGLRMLRVMEEEPQIETGAGIGGPLTPEKLKRNTRGVRLRQPAIPEQVQEEWAVPLDYPCPHCPEPFPSAPARDRHVQIHHAVT